jgi:hypothetical protein
VSQALFLVRLRSVFRVREIYSVRVDRLPAEALFSSRTNAEHYIATQPQIAHNPFARTLASIHVVPPSIYLDGGYEHAATYRSYDWNWLMDRIQHSGVELPDECGWNPEIWPLWWDVVTIDQSDAEKAAFREHLELPNWGENPFRMADILAGDRLELFYMVPLEMLVQQVTDLGLDLPKDPNNTTELIWEHWWNQNAARMTDKQKITLWQLLDPEPCEIIEVEFER